MGEVKPHVILVAYRGAEWLPGCLDDLSAAVSSPWELVLVDNAGDNGLERLPLDELPCRVLGTPGPMGFAEANNFALRAVGEDADAVCFLNQDTKSGPGWLDACLAVMREDERIGAVSPLLRTYEDEGWDPHFLACARRSPDFEAVERETAAVPRFIEVPEVTAAAMVVRGDVLRRVGPFDPIFGSYYEDYDLCRRIREAGYRIGIATGGRVYHYSGSATNDAAAERRRMRLVLRNRAIHRVRSAGSRRCSTMIRALTTTFGYNLGRGLVGTASSQPPGVQFGAQFDLLRLVPRLMSAKRDDAAWNAYLAELGWPNHPLAGAS